MKIFLIFLAIIGLSVLALLFMKLKISIEYIKNQGEKAETKVNLIIFWGKVKINIPLDKKKAGERRKKHGKKIDTKDKENKSILQKIKDTEKTISDIRNVYKENKGFIKRHIVLESGEVYIKFGLLNAAATGIATGAIWSVLYQILALLCSIGTVKEHSFDVVPVFNSEGFCIRTKGIISFRMINIIIAAAKVYFAYRQIR